MGASLNDILAKRNQRPEVRKAQRDQAIRYVLCFRELWFFADDLIYYSAAKEQKKATKATKKAAAPPKAKNLAKTKAAKNVQKAAPRVGGKR